LAVTTSDEEVKMAFKPGDTVRLRSGGPIMTVERLGVAGGEDTVWCVWFEKTKQERGYFAPAVLEADTPGSGIVGIA
jgi:uncharacterized protein YodC (DUF2158 family)